MLPVYRSDPQIVLSKSAGRAQRLFQTLRSYGEIALLNNEPAPKFRDQGGAGVRPASPSRWYILTSCRGGEQRSRSCAILQMRFIWRVKECLGEWQGKANAICCSAAFARRRHIRVDDSAAIGFGMQRSTCTSRSICALLAHYLNLDRKGQPLHCNRAFSFAVYVPRTCALCNQGTFCLALLLQGLSIWRG